MSLTGKPSEKNRAQYAYNLTMAAVAGQVGCLTLVIVLAALFGGLWLDARLDTRPTFTVVLLLASIPVTLVAMLWVVRKATGQMKPTSTRLQTESNQEEADRGTKSDT